MPKLKFVTLTTGDRNAPQGVEVNPRRVIWIEDADEGGSVLHCNDSHDITVFESRTDVAAAFNGDDRE